MHLLHLNDPRELTLTISTVHSRLLSEDDRARVSEALTKLEGNGELPESVKEPVLRLLRLVAEGRSATILETEKQLPATRRPKSSGSLGHSSTSFSTKDAFPSTEQGGTDASQRET